jgi:hypothetical protein
VLRDSARLVVGGVAVAAIVVLALGSLLRGLLFGIGTTDPRTLLAIGVVTTLFAMTAAYVPGPNFGLRPPTSDRIVGWLDTHWSMDCGSFPKVPSRALTTRR